jgi:hypothetical protein
MKNIKYQELENLKEFKKENNCLVWSPFEVDNFMGFTVFRIRATEGENGVANLKYTEEYIMSGNSNEKECIEEKYIERMKDALKQLLTSN